MKILWLAPLRPVPWVSELAAGLINNYSIDLTILKFDSTIKNKIEYVNNDGINYIYIKIPRSRINIFTLTLFQIFRLNKFLKNYVHRYDLIHLHGTEQRQFVASFRYKIPQVLSIQGILTECKKYAPINDRKFYHLHIGSLYEILFLDKINYYSCRTHWDKNFIKNINSKATIYHNWEMLRPQFYSDHFSLKKSRILFMGGTNILKGWREMILAFNEIKKYYNLKLIIVGQTNQKLLFNFIKKSKLSNIVPGDIEIRDHVNTDELIKSFDESFCLVHPSYIDNSPNSVCEAQVAGLPVIASNVGGVKSLIEDRETGLLVDGSVQDIVAKLSLLLKDNDSLKNISKKSREIARKRHCHADILSKTIQMYREILNFHKGN